MAVARGRRFIAFNATARQIQSALATEIHHFRVEWGTAPCERHETSVPQAIQPLVLGPAGPG